LLKEMALCSCLYNMHNIDIFGFYSSDYECTWYGFFNWRSLSPLV